MGITLQNLPIMHPIQHIMNPELTYHPLKPAYESPKPAYHEPNPEYHAPVTPYVPDYSHPTGDYLPPLAKMQEIHLALKLFFGIDMHNPT